MWVGITKIPAKVNNSQLFKVKYIYEEILLQLSKVYKFTMQWPLFVYRWTEFFVYRWAEFLHENKHVKL